MRVELNLGAVVVFVVVFAALSGCGPKDDTDPKDGRSGIASFTDHKTGCQYLARPFGALTPRLNASGKQVGCRDE